MDERVKQRILSRQKAVRPVIKEERPWRNADGYYDPTASLAIERISREERMSSKRRRRYKSGMAKKANRFQGKADVTVNKISYTNA